jgi:hypothetical protein
MGNQYSAEKHTLSLQFFILLKLIMDRVLGDAYFSVPVRTFITAGRKYFRARIPRTLNFAWGRINITNCLTTTNTQMRQRVSVCR